MKKLIVLLSMVLLAGCIEQEPSTSASPSLKVPSDSPSEEAPVVGVPNGTLMNITSASLNDSNLWVFNRPLVADLALSETGFTYSSLNATNYASAQSKFKMAGDNVGNIGITTDISVSSGLSAIVQLFLSEDFSKYIRVGVYYTGNRADIVVTTHSGITRSMIMYPTGDAVVSLVLARYSNGSISFSVNGTSTTFSDLDYSGNIDVNFSLAGAGNFQLQNWSVSNSSYLTFSR